VLSDALHNFYQGEAQGNQKSLLHVTSGETDTSINGCEDSKVDGMHNDFSTTELKSMLQVWLCKC